MSKMHLSLACSGNSCFCSSGLKGMSGGFCKHFLRSFLLFRLYGYMVYQLFGFTYKKYIYIFLITVFWFIISTCLILCIFRICYSRYTLNSVLESHVFNNLCIQSASFTFTIEPFKSLPCVYFSFFNLCRLVLSNNSVTDKIAYVYQDSVTHIINQSQIINVTT